MTTQVTARTEFRDEARGVAVVRVQTSLCFYSVAIESDKVTIVGPGIEKTMYFDNSPGDLPTVPLTKEGIAIIAVTMLEESDE